MSLPTSNITMTAVNTELSSPYSPATNMLLSVLAPHANAGNIASFYGTGVLAVDASKNVYWIAPTNNYKLGDFRGYNATATMPAASNNFTQNWGPGGSSVSMTMTSLPQTFNVLFVDSGATRIYYKAYLSTANRTAETSVYDSQLSSVLFNSITALTGHTRSQTQQIQHPHVQAFNPFDTSGLVTPNDYVYMDTFFANVGGSRVVNFGDAIANGYTTITMHEYQNPYVDGSGTISSPPAGYTVAYPVVYSTSAACSDSNVTQTYGSTSYSFYVGIHGIYGVNTRSMRATSATVTLTIGGTPQVVYSGVISNSSKTLCSGTLSGGRTWGYDEIGYVTISVSSWHSSYTTCI